MLPWTQAVIFQLRNKVLPLTYILLPFDKIQRKHKIPKQLFYSYLQFKHYFASKSSNLALNKPTSFELLCAQDPYQTCLISDIYRSLHDATPLIDKYHSYMQKWSQLIKRPIPLPLWQNICVEQRETTYKIFFWYRTAEIIHRYDPKTPWVCWRCQGDIGLHFHIFGECPLIQPFWSFIQVHLHKLLTNNLPLDPDYYLIGLPFPGIPRHTQKWTAFILLAARRAIPLKWLSPSPPTLQQDLQILEQNHRMEHLTAVVNYTLPKFSNICDL